MEFFLCFLDKPVDNFEEYFCCINLEKFRLNEICQLIFQESVINFYISNRYDPGKCRVVFKIDDGQITLAENNPRFKNTRIPGMFHCDFKIKLK